MRTVGEDVESLFFLHEFFCRLLDCCHVCQVKMQELDSAVGARVRLLDFLSGGVVLLLGAAGEVDGAIVLVEDLA